MQPSDMYMFWGLDAVQIQIGHNFRDCQQVGVCDANLDDVHQICNRRIFEFTLFDAKAAVEFKGWTAPSSTTQPVSITFEPL